MTTEVISGTTIERSQEGYQRAQEQLGGKIEGSQGNVSLLTAGNGLDVLKASPMDNLGIRIVDVDVKDLLRTPQVLARILLFHNLTLETYQPAVLVPKPGRGNENVIRFSVWKSINFKPEVGLTPGIRLVSAFEAETQAPGFGSHGNGRGPSGFEPGHLTTAVTAGINEASAASLKQLGDVRSHQVMSEGVPHVLASLGRLKDLPKPTTIESDVRQFNAGFRWPLAWHDNLETNGGAALATFAGPDGLSAADLLLGRVFYDMTDKEIYNTSQNVGLTIRGVES
ncbi:MAG TPA: hypothetical protein VGF75_01740 [Candidatus Saccharimonadales bacterium]|jgi:hypothetical protein